MRTINAKLVILRQRKQKSGQLDIVDKELDQILPLSASTRSTKASTPGAQSKAACT